MLGDIFGHLGHLVGHFGSLGHDSKEELLAIAFGQNESASSFSNSRID